MIPTVAYYLIAFAVTSGVIIYSDINKRSERRTQDSKPVRAGGTKRTASSKDKDLGSQTTKNKDLTRAGGSTTPTQEGTVISRGGGVGELAARTSPAEGFFYKEGKYYPNIDLIKYIYNTDNTELRWVIQYWWDHYDSFPDFNIKSDDGLDKGGKFRLGFKITNEDAIKVMRGDLLETNLDPLPVYVYDMLGRQVLEEITEIETGKRVSYREMDKMRPQKYSYSGEPMTDGRTNRIYVIPNLCYYDITVAAVTISKTWKQIFTEDQTKQINNPFALHFNTTIDGKSNSCGGHAKTLLPPINMKITPVEDAVIWKGKMPSISNKEMFGFCSNKNFGGVNLLDNLGGINTDEDVMLILTRTPTALMTPGGKAYMANLVLIRTSNFNQKVSDFWRR